MTLRDEMAAAVDRFEHAARAYERLGKLTRDDEKTRQIRKDTMAEMAAARRALMLRLLAGEFAEMTPKARASLIQDIEQEGRK